MTGGAPGVPFLTIVLEMPAPATEVMERAGSASISATSLVGNGQKVRPGSWRAMQPFRSRLVALVGKPGGRFMENSAAAGLHVATL